MTAQGQVSLALLIGLESLIGVFIQAIDCWDLAILCSPSSLTHISLDQNGMFATAIFI